MVEATRDFHGVVSSTHHQDDSQVLDSLRLPASSRHRRVQNDTHNCSCISLATRSARDHLIIQVAGTLLSTLTSKSLHFYNIRPLNLQPLQHQPQPVTFDFTREGLDFSIWEIEVASGLSGSQYEHIRQMVEDGLNTQIAAVSMAHGALMARRQGPLFNSATDPARVDMTTDQEDIGIRVVAIYDTDVGCNAPAECKLFFSYPVGEDPTVAFYLLKRKNNRLLALSKTLPIVDALRDVGDGAQ